MTVEGMLADHPADAPELYCFYQFCVPAARVPVQLLPPVRPSGTKAACLPHPSYEYAWAATEDGRAFFRLTEEEQAQALADYDANPVLVPPTTAAPLPPIGAAASRPKRGHAHGRHAGGKRPKLEERVNLVTDSDDDADRTTRFPLPTPRVYSTSSVWCLNDSDGGPGESAILAQDPDFAGRTASSGPCLQSARRWFCKSPAPGRALPATGPAAPSWSAWPRCL